MCQVLLGTHPRFWLDGIDRLSSQWPIFSSGLPMDPILNYSVYLPTLHPAGQLESAAFGQCPRSGDSVDEMWWQPFPTLLDWKNLWKFATPLSRAP